MAKYERQLTGDFDVVLGRLFDACLLYTSGLVFRKGEILKKVPQEQLVDALREEIERF